MGLALTAEIFLPISISIHITRWPLNYQPQHLDCRYSSHRSVTVQLSAQAVRQKRKREPAAPFVFDYDIFTGYSSVLMIYSPDTIMMARKSQTTILAMRPIQANV